MPTPHRPYSTSPFRAPATDGRWQNSTVLVAAERQLRELIDRLRPGTSGHVKVSFTNNTCTMVSKYERAGTIHLRVHHLFAQAPAWLLEDLVRFCFLRVRKKTSRRIRADLMDFVEKHREKTLSLYPENRRLPPRGSAFDLKSVMRRVRRGHVQELKTTPDIAWTRRVHRTLMGKWVPSPPPYPNLIVINRLLDDARVPLFYLEFIVFHELLHELMPISRSCGRWVHHPLEFRQRERCFPDFERAQRWEEENVGRLYSEFRCRRRRAE